MKLGIMQPYFLPYIGYFQLMNAVDEFVVYDNIEYTKKGWINRNRILVNGKDNYITIPIKKDSDYVKVVDRYLAETWVTERIKLINRIVESYRKAPEFENVFPLVKRCIMFEEANLFKFIYNSLIMLKDFLEIQTSIIISSSIPINHNTKAEKKIIEICKARKADRYINPIGGLNLYDKKIFNSENIELSFIKSSEITYNQFNNDFVPWLSIIDVMMFNEKERITRFLNEYKLI